MTTLTDGTEVVIRPIRASDKVLLAAGFSRLSETTVRKRFLGPKKRLTGAELRYLTEVDGLDHHAIVAVEPGWDGDILAVARYVRLAEDPLAAEAAIVVCDALQGQGLGKLLARMIADAARSHGIRRIHATMSSENPPAMALMQVIAERLRDGGHDHGVHLVVAELAA